MSLTAAQVEQKYKTQYATVAAATTIARNFKLFSEQCTEAGSNPVLMLNYMIDAFTKARAGGHVTRVLEFLDENPFSSVKEITVALDKSESYVRRELIETLIDTSLISKRTIRGKTRPRTGYCLTLAGFHSIRPGEKNIPEYLQEDRSELCRNASRAIAKLGYFQDEEALYIQLMAGQTEELDGLVAQLKLQALDDMNELSPGTKK